jgi:hypothetical protein
VRANRFLASLFAAVSVSVVVAAAGCSSSASSSTPSGGASATAASPGPAATPTPSWLRRTNPNIIEEDEVHFVERIPKKDAIRIDDRHFRYGISPQRIEFYKEDADYFYVYKDKKLADEEALRARQLASGEITPTAPSPAKTPVVPLSEFENLEARRLASSPLRFEETKNTGLPQTGLWRASFVVADMNGDGIPDLIAPPARLGGQGFPHVWLGDGHGHYTLWNLQFTEHGKPASFGVDYGGIAVGDIDGDGHMDIVCASHVGGLVSFFGDGKGGFEVVHDGLPGRELSAQAVTLVDADGDGKLDIVVSKDAVDPSPSEPVDLNQVRLYVFKPGRKWEYRPNSLPGAAYSYSLATWDFDGDGRGDVLTGSHFFAAQVFLWKNGGKGVFAPVAFPEIESYAFHYRTVPGTWGPGKRPAFAETYQKYQQTPYAKAIGINVYSLQGGEWTKHPVFRKKDVNPYLYALGYGDLDGDGRDDIVFPDNVLGRVRIFLQQPDGSFAEVPEAQEPAINSPAACVRLLDVDRDGRVDIVIAKTVGSTSPNDPGGWSIYRNVR